MDCLICRKREKLYRPNGEHREAYHDKVVKSFICSNCTQAFLGASESALRETYHKALSQKRGDLAEALKNIVEVDDEIGTARRNMARERIGHEARPAHYRQRAK